MRTGYAKVAPDARAERGAGVNLVGPDSGPAHLAGILGTHWSSMDKVQFFLMIAAIIGVGDYVAACGEINKAVLERFRSLGIVMPFPQREVRLLGEAG